MAVTAEQMAQLRRMVAEPSSATYDDYAIQTAITARAVPDSRGVEPYVLDYSTTPPTQSANTVWIETYDLNAAAADIWEEKGAAVACDFSFQADGASYSRDQVHAQYLKQAGRYRSRQCLGSQRLATVQRELTTDGDLVETVPIIDRYQHDEAFNA